MQPLILDDDQAKIVHEMVHTDTGGGYVLASEQGAGKTVIVAQYIVEAKPEFSLIICPLGTRVGWERTLRRQGYAGPILRVESTKAGKLAESEMLKGTPGVYLMGRELFRTKTYWPKVRPNLAAYDEVHAIQNKQSVGFKRAKQLRADYKIAMSGTWMGNKFSGAWAPSFWVFGKPTVDNSYWRWAAEFAEVVADPFAGQVVQGEKIPGAFVASLPGYARLTPDIGVDYTEEQRYVELSPAQRKAYLEMEQNLVTWLGDNPLVAEVPITMRIRLRQMTLGMPSFNDEGEIDFALDCKSTKIDALKEIISDLDDEPVLILTDSQKFARVTTHRLNLMGKTPLAVEWSGKTASKDRERILETFGRKGGPRYIVATIAAIGEGVDNLQSVCNTAVWLSRSDNRIMNEQAAKRLHRRGQTRPVRSIDILALDTYDENVLSSQVKAALAMNESMRRERSK